MRKTGKTLGILLALALLASPFVVWWKWNEVYDWYRLRDYTPASAVSQLANQDTMTSYAQHLFYVNHAQLVDGVSAFRTDCPENEQTIVLGCYHPLEDGIYIYNVSDSQLAGIQQVTAAHEMLHAAYGRLSAKDRANVDDMINAYFNSDEHNQRIIDEMNLYKKTEPNSVMDELHSVLGTEEGSLPANLEAYYSRYFGNRQAVIAFANNYQAAFTNRMNQINADDTTLATMKQQIDSQKASLSSQAAQISSDRSRLDAERSSGDLTTYNAGVDSFNAEVNKYNAGIASLQAEIDSYNNLVSARNAIAAEIQTLDNAIDTRLTTVSGQ